MPTGLIRRKSRRVIALDSVSFSVNAGELIGYIGPNGAGKSTTVKNLSGIMVPDGGSVHVLGKIPWNERIDTVRQMGVVFGQRTLLWWDLPVIESFDLLRDICRVPEARLPPFTSLQRQSSPFHFPIPSSMSGWDRHCCS